MAASIFTQHNLEIGSISSNECGDKNGSIGFSDGYKMSIHYSQRYTEYKTPKVLVIIDI